MQGAKREYRYAFAYRIPRTYDHLNGHVGALRPSKGTRIGESVVKYSRTNPVPHKRVFETKALAPGTLTIIEATTSLDKFKCGENTSPLRIGNQGAAPSP